MGFLSQIEASALRKCVVCSGGKERDIPISELFCLGESALLPLMKSLPGLLVAASLMVLTGCSTTNYVQQPKADSLAGLKSFAWDNTTKLQASGDLAGNRPLYLDLVHKDVEAGLVGKGYVRVPKRDAKLLVESTIVTKPIAAEKVDAVFESNQDTAVAAKSTRKVFEFGTIIVNIEDARTHKVLWRGAVTKVVNRDQPYEVQKVVVKKAVFGLLRQIPSAQ